MIPELTRAANIMASYPACWESSGIYVTAPEMTRLSAVARLGGLPMSYTRLPSGAGRLHGCLSNRWAFTTLAIHRGMVTPPRFKTTTKGR